MQEGIGDICTEVELPTKGVEPNRHSKESLQSTMHKSISTASLNQGLMLDIMLEST